MADSHFSEKTRRRVRSLALAAVLVTITTLTALAIAVSSTLLPATAQVATPPTYTNVTSANVVGDPNQKSVIYQVSTVGNIPKKVDTFIASKLCYGYGWISDPNEFNGISDPNQRPAVIATLGGITSVVGDPCQIGDPNLKKVWNTQTVTLAKPNGPVCLVGVQDPNERTSIRGNTLKTALNLGDATIFPSTFALAASFELQQDTTSCPLTSTTGLKVVPFSSVGDPNE